MKSQLAPTIILLCWAGVSAPALVLAEQPLIVGVLEDVEPGNLSPGMAVAHVRIAFKKQGAEWVDGNVYRNSTDDMTTTG